MILNLGTKTISLQETWQKMTSLEMAYIRGAWYLSLNSEQLKLV